MDISQIYEVPKDQFFGSNTYFSMDKLNINSPKFTSNVFNFVNPNNNSILLQNELKKQLKSPCIDFFSNKELENSGQKKNFTKNINSNETLSDMDKTPNFNLYESMTISQMGLQDKINNYNSGVKYPSNGIFNNNAPHNNENFYNSDKYKNNFPLSMKSVPKFNNTDSNKFVKNNYFQNDKQILIQNNNINNNIININNSDKSNEKYNFYNIQNANRAFLNDLNLNK